MEVTRESLKVRYQGMDTNELIRILDEGNLTELAKGVMQEELDDRNLSSNENINHAREQAYAPEPFKENGMELTKNEIILQGEHFLLGDVISAENCRYTKWSAIISGFLGLVFAKPIINTIASALDPQSSNTMDLTTMDYAAGISIAFLSLVFLLVLLYGIFGEKA